MIVMYVKSACQHINRNVNIKKHLLIGKHQIVFPSSICRRNLNCQIVHLQYVQVYHIVYLSRVACIHRLLTRAVNVHLIPEVLWHVYAHIHVFLPSRRRANLHLTSPLLMHVCHVCMFDHPPPFLPPVRHPRVRVLSLPARVARHLHNLAVDLATALHLHAFLWLLRVDPHTLMANTLLRGRSLPVRVSTLSIIQHRVCATDTAPVRIRMARQGCEVPFPTITPERSRGYKRLL